MSNNYYDKTITNNEDSRLIERDKKAFELSVLKWIEAELPNISRRKLSLQQGCKVKTSGYFIKLLKEAELNFTLGAFYSALSLTYILTEDICKFLSKKYNINSSDHYKRIKQLEEQQYLTPAEASVLQEVRKKRNDIWHSNEDGFKKIEQTQVEEYTLNEMSNIKNALSSIFERIDEAPLNEFGRENSLVEDLMSSDYGSTLNQDELIMKHRNETNDLLNFNIAPFDAGVEVQRGSMFYVTEVDLKLDIPELTLQDIFSANQYYIDLPEDKKLNLQKFEGEILSANIISKSSIRGQTESWALASYEIIAGEQRETFKKLLNL